MSDVDTWSPIDESNTAPPPNGWPEFMLPSAVNNSARAMMGAVRRMYDKQVDGTIVLPYLKLSGGSLSGGLGITGGLTASGTVQGSYLYSTGAANVAGALGVTGGISAGTTITAGTRVTASSGELFGSGWAIFGTGGNLNIGTDAGGNLAALTLYANTVTAQGTLTAGSATINGNVSVTGGMTLSGPNLSLGGDVNFGMQLLGNNNRLLGFAGGFYFEFDLAGPDDLHYTSPLGVHFMWRESDGFAFAARNAVGGNGAYINISDRRVKNAETIAPAIAGLPAILQLQPVEFERLTAEGGPLPKRELGFIAQDVASVLPQAVTAVGVKLPDGSGGLDSAEPTLGVTSEAIVAAIVNALKTIDQRLTAGGL
jgi:hypothetical protein